MAFQKGNTPWNKGLTGFCSGSSNFNFGKFGENHPKFGSFHSLESRELQGRANRDKPRSEEHKRKNREAAIRQFSDPENRKSISNLIKEKWKDPIYRYKLSGKNANGWKGGSSFIPYSVEFTNELKRRIRERDKYTCQLCFKYGNSVHHIDEDKSNCDPTNLITLCRSCNTSITHKDKGIWVIFYQPYFGVIANKV